MGFLSLLEDVTFVERKVAHLSSPWLTPLSLNAHILDLRITDTYGKEEVLLIEDNFYLRSANLIHYILNSFNPFSPLWKKSASRKCSRWLELRGQTRGRRAVMWSLSVVLKSVLHVVKLEAGCWKKTFRKTDSKNRGGNGNKDFQPPK